MYETITVDEAIKKGRVILFYVPFGILMISVFVPLYLGTELKMNPWLCVMGAFAGIIGACVWWGIKVTEWKIWAFENVRNLHELKKRAIEDKLIYNDGSFFEKTEIWTKEKKEKWIELQSKLTREDKFEDDLTVLDETLIFFSKTQSTFGVILFVILFFGGLYLLLTQKLMLGIVPVVVGGYLAFISIRMQLNKMPQIIISNHGIGTSSVPLVNWENIEYSDVIREGFGKNRKDYFVFAYADGGEKIDISELAINKDKLYKLLLIYRGRFKKRAQRMDTLERHDSGE